MGRLAPLPCVAPDFLDMGESDPLPRPLSLAEHAELLADVAEQVAPGPKIVVGHHTGAAFAAHVAATRREHVRGLCLIGYPLYDDWRDRYARFAYAKPTDVDDEGLLLAEKWRGTVSAYAPHVPYETRLSDFTDLLRAGRIWYASYVALFSTDLRALLAAARDDERPTVLVSPERDSLARYAAAAGEILDVEPVRIPGGGRVTVEQPDEVAAQIRPLV